ncbi:hypothetical protein BaRGS_00013425 [Batillaria attramentaria]|uniref:Pheromone n=1 Tax=Batillaria attramentaria TaxID=370345 RepID=A0ABD0L7I5_9CAEN
MHSLDPDPSEACFSSAKTDVLSDPEILPVQAAGTATSRQREASGGRWRWLSENGGGKSMPEEPGSMACQTAIDHWSRDTGRLFAPCPSTILPPVRTPAYMASCHIASIPLP